MLNVIEPGPFNQHGTVMLATIPSSSSNIADGIQIVKIFIRLRSVLGTHKELARKVETVEKTPRVVWRRLLGLSTRICSLTENCRMLFGLDLPV